MAAPTAPTRATILSEALNIAGYGASPASALTTRGQEWFEEIKNEIWMRERKLKSLMTSSIQALTNGLPLYSNPSDYASDLALTFLTGTVYGTAQAGAASTITLAASTSSTEADLIGKEVYVYSGTGSGQRARITAYNSSTKVATVSPSWSTTPDNTSLYLIVGHYRPLDQKPLWYIQQASQRAALGEPVIFCPLGDSQYGKYQIHPTPYRTDSQPMLLLQEYYANLMTLDLAGTLMATLYQNWREVWHKGIIARAWRDMDDNRQILGLQEADAAIRRMIGREKYGADMSVISSRVTDY